MVSEITIQRMLPIRKSSRLYLCGDVNLCRRGARRAILTILLGFLTCTQLQGANRSTYIPYDMQWIQGPTSTWIAFDQLHQQIFTAWRALDRIDVLSAVDYHVIHSIRVPSPSSVDISPDGTTLAVATSSAHILFFDTFTFEKTNDVVFADSALGVSAFVYTANGNGLVRAEEGLSTGGGITAYWDQVGNAFVNQSNAEGVTGPYSTTGPIARSGDYSRIILGDETGQGIVQIVDGNTGQPVQQLAYFDSYIMGLAANKDASRYALCVEPAGMATLLIVLDASFNEIYQDEAGCYAATFSADGSTLYRDVAVSGSLYTQALNMTTFSATNVTTYFTGATSYNTIWQAADSTGMVYGVNPNMLSTAIFVAVDTAAGSTPAVPAVNDPVQIIRVIDNIGSPNGGDVIRLLCSGVDKASSSSVSVSIGGESATTEQVATVASLFPGSSSLPNLRIVEVKTPEGTPGLADVTLNVNGTSDTAAKAFQYAQSTNIFPFASSPSYLLYDNFRQKLYAAHQDEVEVIDPVSQQVLTPLIPAGGKLTNSQFAGLSLSPDGNRLYIADVGANLIHMLDLTVPGTGFSINPQVALGATSPVPPGRVFETASGKLVGTNVSAIVGGLSTVVIPIFVIDPASGKGASMTDQQGNAVWGYAWNSTNAGNYVVISRELNGLISGQVGLWNDAISQFSGATSLTSLADETIDGLETSANEDGTVIAVGGSTPGMVDEYPQIVDFNSHSAGFIEDHFDVPMPIGTPSFFLHPSGALLYKAGIVQVGVGPTPFSGLVEIDDFHQFQPTATVVFPEAFITSYQPYINHMLTTDATGRYLFGITTSGITEMVLNTIPLSVGNLQPAFGPTGGGETVTIRGSGFMAGAVASFGGTQAPTTFVDSNTLTVVIPALSAGWQDVTVTNPNGASYTAPGIFQVLAAEPTPVISGFSPAELAVESDIAGFDQPLEVAVVGSGFAAYDTVEVNGEPSDSEFIDTAHLEAVIPAALTGTIGSVSLTVTSPYTGTSNAMSLPMVNPVPVIDYGSPLLLNTGTGGSSVWVSGTNFVNASVVQWNGQNLSTSLVQGENAGTGDETVIGVVPSNLLTGTGTATITVFNPTPGGGTSNQVTLNLASSPPQVAFPTSIAFGEVVLNSPATQTVQLSNTGSSDYKMASATLTNGAFSAQAGGCSDVPPQSSCNLQVQFSPTVAGAATGTLIITDNTQVSPHTIPVTGTGVSSLAPIVAITSINVLGRTVQATINGTATVGGATVPATAWLEYGTDQTMTTYTQSGSWGFSGDGTLSRAIYGLSPATTYAARLVVQTAAGTGQSPIRLFATMAAPPAVAIALASGASNTATISAGQTATYQLVASDGGNGYTGTAVLSCSDVPNQSTCTFSPASVSIGMNPVPFTVTVVTTAASEVLPPLFPPAVPWSLAVLLAMIALAVGALPGKRRAVRLAMWIAALTLFAFACGGGGSSGSSGRGSTVPTSSGTYGLLINASAGGAQTTYMLTLTVK